MNPENDRKSILDFSLQLGIRTEAVLQAMRDMGLSADESAEIDADEESVILDHLIENGAIPSRLAKKSKPRNLSERFAVPDDLLLEALGASENGFSDAYIPRQVLFEQNLKNKSLFQKWFGPKNELASSIKEKSLNPDAVESMFISADEILEHRSSPSRSQQAATPPDSESPSPDPDSDSEEQIQNKAPDAPPSEEPVSEDELEEIEIDSDLLENIEGIDEVDFEDSSSLDDVDMNGLEDLDLDDETLEDSPSDSEDEEELEDLFEEDDLDDASPENEENTEKTENTKLYEIHAEEAPSNFLERLLFRIRLSPAEMWTLMIGSAVVMLVLLGATLYWWIFASPRALESVLAEANSVYNRAVELETPEWRRGRILWKKPRDSFAEAAALFKDYLESSPKDPQALKLAYKNMCDCYYRIAAGDKQEGDQENSGNAFRQMAALYENYLDLIEKVAGVNIGDPQQPQLAFPELEDQRLALYRIALAKRELEQFDHTIRHLQDFIDRFPNTDQAMDAMIEIGNSYQEWAKSKKDQERPLLAEAVNAYKTALEALPDSDSFRRMQIYAKIGDVNHAIYEYDRSRERPEEANQYLIESIANYEKAVGEINQDDQSNSQTSLPPSERRDRRDEIQKVQKKLADLYLTRGGDSAKQWRNYEETAEPFPDFIIYKQQMLEEAQRQQESAKRLLGQANSLFDQLLAQSDSLSDQDYEDILYNKAYSFFIMRDYPQALAAGETLLQSTDAHKLSDPAKTKILYLLGDAAWEQAKENNDYAVVKDYYYRALEQDPFYPAEEKGDSSHLADIRLINAYYLREPDKDYPEAIRRFENMVNRYPESGYAYLTLYYFAKTLEEYGDELTAEAERLRREAAASTSPDSLLAQARNLEDKARDQYDLSVIQYNKAVSARDSSKYVDTQNERYLKHIIFHRGHSAFKKGEYRLAEDYYRQAIERYGGDNSVEEYKPLVIERLGDLNVRLKNYDQAVKHYMNYLNNAYENKDMRVTIKLADAYLDRFSWDQARNWYRKIINNDPLTPTDAQVDNRIRSGQSSPKGPGFLCLKRIAESHRREALTQSFEERAAKLTDAVKAYQDLADKYPLGPDQNRDLPDDPDSIRTMAQIHLELENYDQAARCFEKFLELKPNYSRQGLLLYNLGQSYIKVAQFDNAIAKLSQITLEMMDNPTQYADALILLGQALQNKANEFLKTSGDETLYTQYLLRAQRTYNRVAVTNQPNKIQEANTMSAAIDSILRSRAELAVGGNP